MSKLIILNNLIILAQGAINDNFKVEYVQVHIFLGDNLKTLDDDGAIAFQEFVTNIVRSGNAKATCSIINQGRIHSRNPRPKPAPRKRRRQRIPTTRRDQ